MGTALGTSSRTSGTALGTSLGTAGARCLLGLLLMGPPGLAAGSLAEPELCYVLDAVLFLFSLILTALYVRLRFVTRRLQRAAEKKEEEAVYAGLSSEHQETYETLQMKSS
ncbi:high affinity immunoglobulin epsilon receptor subunit gamma [Camarhynchus parvulus]|uniref:high affinity immunoglobulin epsilon receptor subunit gamma n=1 Tax=Geospiza parvula TaxID=87175 RepID=UPI0012381711|nr:high affinity immunoglobulin epsilon receptor subunit gamma [Camarhynchus parvulus]